MQNLKKSKCSICNDPLLISKESERGTCNFCIRDQSFNKIKNRETSYRVKCPRCNTPIKKTPMPKNCDDKYLNYLLLLDHKFLVNEIRNDEDYSCLWTNPEAIHHKCFKKLKRSFHVFLNRLNSRKLHTNINFTSKNGVIRSITDNCKEIWDVFNVKQLHNH